MTNTSDNLPRDASMTPLPLTPSILALKGTTNSSLASSATVNLQMTTTLIEVSAISQGIYMKWGGVASSSSFDEYIQAGATRHYVVPSGQTSVQFIQQAASATLILIEK